MPDLTLSLTRLIPAPPIALWRCWTEPALLLRWFTPHPVQTTAATLTPTPGGTFQVTMRLPNNDILNLPAGCILVAESPARLVWTNTLGPGFIPNALGTGPTDFPLTTDLRFTPEASGHHTRYSATVHHATEADRAKHAAMGFETGWGQATDQLAALALSL